MISTASRSRLRVQRDCDSCRVISYCVPNSINKFWEIVSILESADDIDHWRTSSKAVVVCNFFLFRAPSQA